jgi:hypothetical protein
MESYIETFLKTLSWYRKISNKLIDEITPDQMHQQISHRSLTPACQLVDLGDFHLRVASLISGQEEKIVRPDPELANKPAMVAYIHQTQKVLEKALNAIPNKEQFTVTWYDRMTFNLPDVLSFVLAHEAMHHGELMSFIYAKDLPMPKAFTETWGMC